jgi:hypothetical protein
LDAAKAKKEVERLTQDLMGVATQMQNNPEKFEAAILDKMTYTELKEAISDLDTLAEVIVDEN